jgi:hypothetical protein
VVLGNLKKRAFFPIFLILTALSSICHVSDYTVFAALASIPASQDVATDSTRSVNKSYTVIDSDVITDNSGSRKVNWVGSQPGYTYERSAVRFSLAGITGTITNAAFKFYVVDVQGTAVVNLISTIDGSWNERDDSPAFPIYTATDIIYDSAIGPSAPYFNVSVTSGWKTFNVKDYIQSMLDAGKTEVIFVLTGIEGTGTNDFNFVSNQDSDTNSWSKLDLTYTPAPAAPSVSGTTPTVNTRPAWSWTSGGGGSGTYRYKLDNNDLTSGATTTTLSGYTPGSDLSEGSHTLYVQESNGASPVGWSNTGSFTIVVDTTPPAAPVVTGTTPVNNTAPTWTWSPGGGGNGNYRYKFDNSDLTSGATTAAAMSCTPVSALTEGVHTLYVQERDAAGNWSTSGSCAITIDVTPPGAPAVTGTTPTQNTRPTWSWTPGSGGNGSFRYKLDNSDLTNGTTTTSTTGYTPASALAEGVHTLYVQERDAAGNWSSSGSFAITIDTTVPNAPVVSGTTPTNNTTPTWTWTTGGGGGTGSYRYKLDDSDLTSGAATTSAMSCTAGSALGEGVHTLYVQERNTVGNWSASGSFAITIDTTGPNAPVVTGTTPTNDTSPTWAWTTGGGGGTGNYRYKLDNSNLTSGATTASAVSCTAASALTEGVHTLYVQERDAVGNWSASGSFAITIDTTGPNAPVATGTTPTNSTTPTWTWTTGGGGGTGSYRYKLDGSDLTSGATTTSSMSCTAASALGEGAHTLYVQERDAAGNWSSSGSFAITIDTAAPNAPAVTGTTPTNDASPAWTWTSGGGGTGNYRYKLDNNNLTSGATTTSAMSYTSANALTEGIHTLYVQERDTAGNWSASGSFAIKVDTTSPTVSSVDVPADDTYLSGRNLDFTVNFTENVTASSNAGTPYITLTLNTGGVVHATYISGSGTTALVFRYTIASGNDDTDGVLAGGVITANGGTLKDAAGNNAVLSLNNVGSTANVRVDAKVPALTGAARTDNTHITAALSENCTNISRTDNGGFAVLETGTPGTAYTVSSIAQGTDAKHIVLTVADMSISAKEGITVKYTAGVSGAIQDMAGNAMETDNAGISINGWDVAPPAIVSATLASNNEYIDITFSEGIYNADDGAAAITKDKLVLSFTKGSGSATNVQIKSVRKHDDSVVTSASALSGGETIVRVFLEITGIPNGAEKIMIKPADGASLYDKAGNAMAAAQTTGEKTLNNQQPVQSNDNQQPSTAPPSNPPPVKEDKPVIDAPTTVDVKKEDGKTVTIATVDDKKLEEMLKTEDNGSTITIPVNNGSDVVTGQLNGQTIKAMEDKEAVLEIKTENVTYTLPASQINIDSISGQLGSQVALKDIKVNITIAEPSQNTVKIVEDTANKNSYQIVVKPVEFEITCTSAGKTVDVSRFNGYVERTIAIPDGVDPSKITTGIVLNNDGTFSHVPTTIVVIDGKYYAKINSLTNSTYSVIWNPKTFADMEKHWAKADVNDLASRLIIEGIDKDHYAPDQKITRAEYVTTLVKALGIMKPGTGKAVFNDVDRKARYYDAVGIAYEYGLITGNGNGGFKPEDKITREEALTILVRSMMLVKLNAKATDGEIKQLLGKYHDNGKISTWAREAVAVCIRNQIITGSGNRIMAKDNITRAETAAIVKRLLKKALLI